MRGTLFTIGHSVHAPEVFLALLKGHGITGLCDVRSSPHSRMNPQFSRENLARDLSMAGIGYFFLGRELGARSSDPSCYDNGKVRYDRLAQTELFHSGIRQLLGEAEGRRVALVCAEKDPLDCHRTFLVAPAVLAADFDVQHILADGSLESHADSMVRLRQQLDMPEYDLFRTPEEVIADACALQASRIAYQIPEEQARAARATAGR